MYTYGFMAYGLWIYLYNYWLSRGFGASAGPSAFCETSSGVDLASRGIRLTAKGSDSRRASAVKEMGVSAIDWAKAIEQVPSFAIMRHNPCPESLDHTIS